MRDKLLALGVKSLNFNDASIYDSIETWFCAVIYRDEIESNDCVEILKCWLDAPDLRIRGVALDIYTRYIGNRALSDLDYRILELIRDLREYPPHLSVKLINIVQAASAQSSSLFDMIHRDQLLSKLIRQTIFHENNTICQASHLLLNHLMKLMNISDDKYQDMLDIPAFVDVILKVLAKDVDNSQQIKALEVASVLIRNDVNVQFASQVCSLAIGLMKRTDSTDRFLFGSLIKFFEECNTANHFDIKELSSIKLKEFVDRYCAVRLMAIFESKHNCQDMYRTILDSCICQSNDNRTNLREIQYCLGDIVDEKLKADYLIRIMKTDIDMFLNTVTEFIDILNRNLHLCNDIVTFLLSNLSKLLYQPRLTPKIFDFLYQIVPTEAQGNDIYNALTKYLTHDDWVVRENILRLICKLDSRAILGIDGIIPMLVGQLNDHNVFVRRHTYQIIGKFPADTLSKHFSESLKENGLNEEFREFISEIQEPNIHHTRLNAERNDMSQFDSENVPFKSNVNLEWDDMETEEGFCHLECE